MSEHPTEHITARVSAITSGINPLQPEDLANPDAMLTRFMQITVAIQELRVLLSTSSAQAVTGTTGIGSSSTPSSNLAAAISGGDASAVRAALLGTGEPVVRTTTSGGTTTLNQSDRN